jgi:hypothetical protein
MNAPEDELTPLQHAGITALLTFKTRRRAAKEIGVDERTIRLWFEKPRFMKAYRAALAIVASHGINQLMKATGRASKALVGNLKASKPADVNRAAIAIIEISLRQEETQELRDKIADLQAQVEAIQQNARVHEQTPELEDEPEPDEPYQDEPEEA